MSYEKSKGFTLIEVLLAISLLAIIISGVYASFYSTMKTIESNKIKSEEYQIARMVLNRISTELTGSLLDTKSSETIKSFEEGLDDVSVFRFVGIDREKDGYPNDSLYFTTAISRWLNRDSKDTEICEIEYFLSTEEDEELNLLLRREDPIVDGYLKGEVLELAEGIAGIDFKYYNDDGEELDHWDSMDKKTGEKIPRAVKIILYFEDNKGVAREYSTTTGIPVNM